MRADTTVRRRHIRDLITSTDMQSQRAIRTALADQGFDVTQATISRDLDVLGATRERAEGRSVYRISADETSAEQVALHTAMDDFVESISISGDLLVLRVPPGAAQFVASRIDAAGLDGVLGSIAGDDTILVIGDQEVGAAVVKQRLEGTG
ncbi:MAG: arginine repressor [Acidimicrobiia bacterium]